MLSSSLYTVLKLSETTSPNKIMHNAQWLRNAVYHDDDVEIDCDMKFVLLIDDLEIIDFVEIIDQVVIIDDLEVNEYEVFMIWILMII